LLAWLVWALIHIQFLAQASLRLSVFVQWVWTYFTDERGSPLIVKHHADKNEGFCALPIGSAEDLQANLLDVETSALPRPYVIGWQAIHQEGRNKPSSAQGH
jgi:hypothetical protein